jgi:hypothetical protein
MQAGRTRENVQLILRFELIEQNSGQVSNPAGEIGQMKTMWKNTYIMHVTKKTQSQITKSK